ncbi:unnamed protein product, partial [Staurois parvus]
MITRRRPVIAKDLRWGGRTVCKQYSSLPCQLVHTALNGCAQHSHAKQHSPIVKHTQHTINPLITPDVNSFLPSAISTVSVLLFSTDHCIGVTGDVSDTKSVPPSVRMPAAVPLKVA